MRYQSSRPFSVCQAGLKNLYDSVRSNIGSPEDAVANSHRSLSFSKAEQTPVIWHLYVESADTVTPVEGILKALKEGGSSPPTKFCHLSPLGVTEGTSIHLCASPGETGYPEKKIARVTDTEDQRKESETL
ncbi:hypothetical protein BTVI_07430 [Pitangus sulphuratus]|nr:hypothetical protein BTVI_07430 [Pitangus sulphuratus]